MWNPDSLPDLSGRVFIVTGANTGIGYVTALKLAAKGAKVYLGGRSSAKVEKAVEDIQTSYPKADVYPMIMDHTSLKSVAAAADAFLSQEDQLNGLILNAGIMNVPFSVTEDGFEIQMQVNYTSHWLLSTKLIPILQSTSRKFGPGSARIVCVTSEGHAVFGGERMLYSLKELEAFGPYGRYGQSKLANVLHAKTLNRKYGPGSTDPEAKNGEIWVAATHPGFVNTQLNENNRDRAHWSIRWIHSLLVFLGIITPWERGCISSLYIGASLEFDESMCGQYFWDNAKLRQPSEAARSQEEREKLEAWTTQELRQRGFVE